MDQEIPTGERWDRTLRQKIDSCAAFVLVMTPHADESAWVGEEIDRARAKGRPILPLLLAGEVFFGFSRLRYDDVTGGAMPGAEFVNRLRELTGAREPEPPVAPVAPDQPTELLYTVDGHTDAVTAVSFSPHGSVLATGSRDRTVRVVPALGYGSVTVLTGHTDTVWALAFTPDGRYLASAGEDGMGILWRRADSTVERALVGHDGPVRALSANPTGPELATGAEDGTIRLWRTDQTRVRVLADSDGPVRALAYAPGGRQLAIGTTGGAHLRDSDGVRAAGLDSGDAYAATAVAWSPDARWVSVAGDDGMVRVHDGHTGGLVRTVRCHSGRVYGIAWSPDGRRFATAGLTGVARVWRAATGELVDTLSGHSGRVFGVAYSPSSGQLATISGDKTTRVWRPSA
jgi:WD40 repeat protein